MMHFLVFCICVYQYVYVCVHVPFFWSLSFRYVHLICTCVYQYVCVCVGSLTILVLCVLCVCVLPVGCVNLWLPEIMIDI